MNYLRVYDNWMGTSNCLSAISVSMTFITALKDSINSWIADVIGYIKSPTDSGGTRDRQALVPDNLQRDKYSATMHSTELFQIIIRFTITASSTLQA